MRAVNARFFVGLFAVAAGAVTVWAILVESSGDTRAPEVAAPATRAAIPAPATAPVIRPVVITRASLERESPVDVADTPETPLPPEAASAPAPVVFHVGNRSFVAGVPPERGDDEAVVEPIVPEPVARAALAFVGADPDADEIWFVAINDPNLPPDERRELIEDLNQDGLPDPANVTADDLPLIASRLALIEEVAEDAMDETNAEAFEEAYFDLLGMYAHLTAEPPTAQVDVFDPAQETADTGSDSGGAEPVRPGADAVTR